MGSKTTIAVSDEIHSTLKALSKDGEMLEDVIKNFLLLRKCPECQDGEMRITRSYMFEPLYFDLKCNSCGHTEKRWRVPFRPAEEAEK